MAQGCEPNQEALKGQKTINEIASRHGVHPVQVTQWKKRMLEELPAVFADRHRRALRETEEEKARLYERIGRLK
jgi:putative transposase